MKTRILFNLLFAYVLSVTWAFGQWTNVPIETNTYDQSETAIAYNPSNSNTMIAVWNDFRVTGSTNAFSKPGFAFSTNGGASWSSNIMTPTGYNNGWDPSAAFNSSGKAFYCYVAQKNPGDTILGPVYVSRTTNLGSTWYHQKVSQYDSLQDKPYIAVDNTGGSRDGRIYVTWTDFYGGSQQILFAYSTNGGSAWTTPTQLVGTANAPTWQSIVAKPDTHHLNPTSGSFVQGSVPAVAPNGDLYVVWLYAQLDSNRAYIKVRRSTDGGSSFQNEVVAAYSPYLEIGYLYYKGPFRATSFPTIAIDPSSGHIYVAYSDGGSQRINFARSTNSGTSWSTPIYASEGNTGYDQFFPWMTVSQSGTISIVYYQGNSDSVSVRVAHSSNGGSSFYTPNTTLKEMVKDSGKATWYSDYIGITAPRGNDVFPVWTDFRNSNPDIYGALYNSSAPAAPQNLQVGAYKVQSNPPLYCPKLTWTANTESDMSTYKIYRSWGIGGGYSYLASVSHPTTSYIDYSINTGSYDTAYYKITAVDVDSRESGYSNAVWIQTNVAHKVFAGDDGARERSLPSEFAMFQNYPNPFNPTTQINYQLAEDARVALRLYDVLGREIRVLVDEQEQAGCRVGGGTLRGSPPSAAQTQRADFPHWAFTKVRF